MSENIIIALIESLTGASTAILTGLLGYWLAQNQLKSTYLESNRIKRLETYPELIKITQQLGKFRTTYEEHKKAREQIINWTIASHGGFLTLSKKSLGYFNQLKDLLKKNAGDGKNYSKEQLKNIFDTRNRLRGSLMDDVAVSGIKNSD